MPPTAGGRAGSAERGVLVRATAEGTGAEWTAGLVVGMALALLVPLGEGALAIVVVGVTGATAGAAVVVAVSLVAGTDVLGNGTSRTCWARPSSDFGSRASGK
jgi:hypothetical protein